MSNKLKELLQNKTSDFYLRKNGIFYKQNDGLSMLCAPLEIDALISDLGYENKLKVLRETKIEQDFSLDFGDVFLRFHLFFTQNELGLNIRVLPQNLPVLDSRYDYFLNELNVRKSGLFLIAGATGSGKTTTANCILDYINNRLNLHIVCIEDPIEYRQRSKKSLFTYREIGNDTKSFESGIISALRLDPDVIFVGELRDKAAIAQALLAAQTGHLVLATIHGSNAQNTLLRFISSFEDRDLASLELSQSIFGIITQKRNIKNQIVCEMLSATHAMRNLIKERKFSQIQSQISISSEYGMMCFDDQKNKARL
ncbi:MAG: ATPase, T2SS/T4P/T4SS family [Helicobacter sp.]|nr:ATPase, T2SS/T4P/T4SS family [Helicobacter sp.]